MKKVYLIAVVFALLAGFATYMFANQVYKKSTIKDADVVAVVFAVQDIPENTLITEEMIAADAGYFSLKADVIKADATPSPISDVNAIIGQVTSVDIHAGEQFNEFKFVTTEDENVGLSYKLSPGKVAFSFTASSTNGVDGYISAGDTVDIITYSKDNDGKVVLYDIVNNFLAFITSGIGFSMTTSEIPFESLIVSIVIDVVYTIAVLALGKKLGWFEPTGDGAAKSNAKWQAKMDRKQDRRAADGLPVPPLSD